MIRWMVLCAGLALVTSRANADTAALQHFVDAQAHEVWTLGDQLETLKQSGRKDAVQAYYHMIRDHVLASDAAQNLVARQSGPMMPSPMMKEETPNTPEAIINSEIQAHERMRDELGQMVQRTDDSDERRLYQRAQAAAGRHLGWLRSVSEGRDTRLGFFGRTLPMGLMTARPEVVRRYFAQAGGNVDREAVGETEGQ